MCIPWKETPSEALPQLGFVETIEMGTINGARALGLGDVTGSLTPGKRADIVLIRTDDINIAPLAQIEATVVMSATPANVDSVMVDGHFVKRHGRLVAVDAAEIVARSKTSAEKIRGAAGGVLTPVMTGRGNPIHRAAC
ncbi:MAG: amidohydrolase family protein, partial [Propylenella sp.]